MTKQLANQTQAPVLNWIYIDHKGGNMEYAKIPTEDPIVCDGENVNAAYLFSGQFDFEAKQVFFHTDLNGNGKRVGITDIERYLVLPM